MPKIPDFVPQMFGLYGSHYELYVSNLEPFRWWPSTPQNCIEVSVLTGNTRNKNAKRSVFWVIETGSEKHNSTFWSCFCKLIIVAVPSHSFDFHRASIFRTCRTAQFFIFFTTGYMILAFPYLYFSAYPCLSISCATLPYILTITVVSSSLGQTSLDYIAHVSATLCIHYPEHLAWMKIQFGKMAFLHPLAQCFEHSHSIKSYS